MTIQISEPPKRPFEELLQHELQQSPINSSSFKQLSTSATVVIVAVSVIVFHKEKNYKNNKPEYCAAVAFATAIITEKIKHYQFTS